MEKVNRWVKIASTVLVGAGIVLFALNLLMGGKLNLALPLVFIMLGVVFFILVLIVAPGWKWAGLLFLPGSLLTILGIIFLINVLTNDWNSWSYAWLLLVAGVGAGLVLTGWYLHLDKVFMMAGAGMVIFGLTFFVVFGMIAGGSVILVMAPILLALGGLALRWVRLETILPERLLRRLAPGGPVQGSPAQDHLVEPLSGRELEVLRLIDQGLSNQEIADRLVVAASTIKTHINNIYGKLGVQTRVQVIHRAQELGLLREREASVEIQPKN
jgi:DNA-binding CsgD family transcriptional regulator